MGLGDLVGKAKDMVMGHEDEAGQAIDKAEDFAKDHVDGHDDQIGDVADKAKDMLGGS